MKTCTKCGEMKALADFAKSKTGRDGIASECKACSRVRALAWKFTNPVARKRTQAAWRALTLERHSASESKRRARKLGGSVSPIASSTLDWLREQCETFAALTGSPWAIDHVIPLARGGPHCESNLRPLPARLNSMKGSRLDDEVASKEFQSHINETGDTFQQITFVRNMRGTGRGFAAFMAKFGSPAAA